MTNFITAFAYSKMRYLTPLLAAEIHHPETLHPLEIASRACMRAELQACKTTPVPLLYAGSMRPHLIPLIKRDAARLILSSISNQTILGREYLAWNGNYDGWTPLGTAMHTFNQLDIKPETLDRRYSLDARVRDGLLKCQIHHDYSREKAIVMHSQRPLSHRLN